jgi:hypothetical protein
MNPASTAALLLAAAILATATSPAYAWGDSGHQVVALVASHYLDAPVRRKIDSILATDTTQLTSGTSLAAEATWADRYRESDRHTTKTIYELTMNWHFANIAIDGSADLDSACFNHPPPASKASEGPARSCIVDRIDAFAAELANPNTDPDERRIALQFVLHLIGDLHQPLHASDDADLGGNKKTVTAPGVPAGSLHRYWDTVLVERLGNRPEAIARGLIRTTTPAQVASWSQGDPKSWALQSFELSKLYTYGNLPQPGSDGTYSLSAEYEKRSVNLVARQLARAGVRLAKVLNEALK